MNKEWSTLQKTMQSQLKKKDTFDEGINTLCYLRKILSWKESLSLGDFDMMPYKNAHGYHNKTIAYSLYHIFRIEDIVCQNLIKKEDDIFFCQRYDQRLNIDIITTGNELQAKEIVDFSIQMNKDELYSYIQEVAAKTNEFLKKLTYQDLKVKMTKNDEERLKKLQVVSLDENSFWLIHYWCQKDIQGLINMPFSRHWIMHIEACLRIKDKLNKGNDKKP